MIILLIIVTIVFVAVMLFCCIRCSADSDRKVREYKEKVEKDICHEESE